MKKVLAINSSKRKLNTYSVLVKIGEILSKSGIEMQIINMHELDIKDCIGCDRCVITDKCVLKDETEILRQKMKEADGIIISSPVYLRQVSGKLKTFADRNCSWFHRPPLYKKPILAVATTKASGLKQTLAYIDDLTQQWGGIQAGHIGRTMNTLEENINEKELETFITLLNNPEKYKPSFSEIMNFNVQKALSIHIIKADTAYWNERGWYDMKYYYDCKVSWFKRLIPEMVGRKMDKAMGAKGIEKL